MTLRSLTAIVALCVCFGVTAGAQKPVKQKIVVNGHERTYLVFTPPPGAEPPALLLLLHGSGRDAASILDPWQSLARKEHIVLVAPDSLDRAGWSLADDGPEFIRRIVDAAASSAGVDGRRMYVFGHSAGGHQALDLGLLESEYFAAAAAHAGVVLEPQLKLRLADRKIPIGLWSGTDDRLVPIDMVRSTEATLKNAGFPVVLTTMPGHTHDYYGVSGQVNAAVWAMLKAEKLTADPKFKEYR